MHFDTAGLTEREQAVVRTLVQACQQLERIYWQQSDPQGLALLQRTSDPQLKRMLLINGGRFNLVGGNAPFVGSDSYLPGHNVYPPGLTRAKIDAYVKMFPAEKAGILNPLTVIRREGAKLRAIPYRVEYKTNLELAAGFLKKAADLSEDAAFAHFLRLRAEALQTDDYYPSDVAWVDLKAPKIDLIFAPYETYLDDVLGVKGSWGAAVLVRNEEESTKLHLYEKYVPAIQEALPLAREDKPSKEGQPTPMEVMDAPFRSGDLRHGYHAVADNLPNDARIHAEKGTKKIFFKNFMDARVKFVVLPLARELMAPGEAALASERGYLAAVVLHEICHGLGPAYARVNGRRADIREAIGPVYAALEEAKADVVGMFGLQWLMDRGALPKERAKEYYASYVAGIFRSVRYGTAEAHGRAEMMEFNFLVENGAVHRIAGKYSINFEAIGGAIEKLAKELLEIEATGDRRRAEGWFDRYDRRPRSLQEAFEAAKNIPIDLDPRFDFPEL